ncbi:DNA (cytosine-5-)-methyltransferase [Candidatus Woesebacteria bacterium]|nr:DNA (cytosine-5-)-methyltransferase [Candidatus Woesebacteria bacterium]
MKKKKYNYIDLFSGSGGFSVGFDKNNFENIFSIDFDKGFCKTYKKNFPQHTLLEKDIKDLKKSEIKNLIKNKDIDVVVGGPPCQGFSIAGNIGRRFVDDPRNYLFKEFIRVVEIIQPKFFVMENVARLYTHNNGNTRNEIITSFDKIGYKVECQILNSADYNVPQIRKRVIFIGTKKNIDILFPKKIVNKYKTVKEAIDDLPRLKSGEKNNSFPNHQAMNHTEQMLKKMSFVKDGGDRSDIPLNLRPKSGDVRKYIKYNSNKPSITVTGDMRKVFHYSQNRALTVRELARLQSYDDDFIFEDNVISQQQQVGNSVPPLMAESIARVIKKMLEI